MLFFDSDACCLDLDLVVTLISSFSVYRVKASLGFALLGTHLNSTFLKEALASSKNVFKVGQICSDVRMKV